MKAQEFKHLGKFIEIDGHNIFVIDTDPIGSKKETLVLLHGFPLTTYDYQKTISMLSEYYRVVSHDHLGFGFSDTPENFNYSIVDAANYAIKLWSKLRLKEFKMVATDYGALMAKEVLFKKNFNFIPFEIRSVVFSQNNSNKLFSTIDAIDYLIRNKDFAKNRELLNQYNRKDSFGVEGKNAASKDTKVRSIWQNFNREYKQKEILVLSNFNEEKHLYWSRWMNAIKNTKVDTTILWRKDDITSINDLLMYVATNQKDNVRTVENRNCISLDESPKQWSLLLLEQLDRHSYHTAKQKYFAC